MKNLAEFSNKAAELIEIRGNELLGYENSGNTRALLDAIGEIHQQVLDFVEHSLELSLDNTLFIVIHEYKHMAARKKLGV